MERTYQHLSAEERAVIMIEHGKGESLRAIGRLLNRNVSSPPCQCDVRQLPLVNY